MANNNDSLICAVREDELIDSFGLSEGYELLLSAVEHNHTGIVKLLLAGGCQVNSKINIEQKISSDTPLHFAVKKENFEVVQLLLNESAATEVFNKHGETPLHYAVQGSLLDITDLLLCSGANVNCVCQDFEQCTPLHLAVRNESITMTNLLLKNDAEVNAVSKDGFTPIHIATCKDHLGIVERLLSQGADVNAATVDGYTALHFAARNGNENIIQLLLANNAEVNAITNKNQTPLYIAIENRRYESAHILMKHGSNIDSEANDGKTILHLAIEMGTAETVRKILRLLPDISNKCNKKSFKLAIYKTDKEYKAVVEDFVECGFTVGPEDVEDGALLHSAVQMGYFEIVKDLLRRGANVSFSQNGYTPLHTAVKNNQVKIATLLIEHGANVTPKGKGVKPPIFYAVYSSNLEMTELLLAQGVNVRKNVELLGIATKKLCKEMVEVLIENDCVIGATDRYGRTALHLTAQNEYNGCKGSLQHDKLNIEARGDIAKLLLENGADVNAKTKSGFTTLHFACQTGFSYVVEAVLEYKADVECLADGRTPLIISAFNGNSSIIEILLKNGANINAKDERFGRTALHYAADEGHTDVLEVLLKENSEVNSQDTEGQTPLHLAASKNALAAVEVLLKHGVNIDDIDIEGQTALHVACEKRYEKIVELLLKFGADVNIVTKNHYSPLELVNSDGEYIYYDEQIDMIRLVGENTLKMLRKRLIMLKMGNLYLNALNEESLSSAVVEFDRFKNIINAEYLSAFVVELDDFKNICEEEIKRMENEEIRNTGVNLYDILSKDIGWLAKYAKNDDIVETLMTERYKDEFPIYFDDLRRNMKKGIERNYLFEQSKGFFKNLLGFPNALANEILKFLTDADIKNLLQAYEQTFT